MAYLHIPKEKRIGKFEAKCKRYIMVGYAPNGYRLLNAERSEVILGKDVIFDKSNTLEIDMSLIENVFCEDEADKYEGIESIIIPEEEIHFAMFAGECVSSDVPVKFY